MTNFVVRDLVEGIKNINKFLAKEIETRVSIDEAYDKNIEKFDNDVTQAKELKQQYLDALILLGHPFVETVEEEKHEAETPHVH